jgi:hypothetical protein
MQRCSHVPAIHRSALQPLPSSQSASLVQPPPGSVVVVVVRHLGVQNSFGLRHGAPGPHGSSLHCSSTVTKHFPSGGGGGQVGTQNPFGRQGRVGPHGCVVHRRPIVSKQVPVGGGEPHAGEQNWFGSGHPTSGEHASPVQLPAMVSKQPPEATHGPSCSLQAPACCRSQSFPYVVPLQPQTGKTTSGQTCGRSVQTPPDWVQLPTRHWQNSSAPQSASALHDRQATGVGVGQARATCRRVLETQRPGSAFARSAPFKTVATQAAYRECGAQQSHRAATEAWAAAIAAASFAPSPQPAWARVPLPRSTEHAIMTPRSCRMTSLPCERAGGAGLSSAETAASTCAAKRIVTVRDRSHGSAGKLAKNLPDRRGCAGPRRMTEPRDRAPHDRLAGVAAVVGDAWRRGRRRRGVGAVVRHMGHPSTLRERTECRLQHARQGSVLHVS